MKQIPKTDYPLIVRTDFSNRPAWEKICAMLRKPVGVFRFMAYVEFLDDIEYANLNKDQLLQHIPKDYNHSFIMMVDQTTIAHPEHPLLVVDLYNDARREFRAIPREIQGIENNLSIANMDFDEFADAVDDDGIFRGFPASGLQRFLSG